MINNAFNDAQSVPDMPFPECGAMSQGYIGYHLQKGLRDVLEEENPDLNICSLLRRKNVIITPHSAFYSQESIEKLQRISGANLGYFLAGKNEEITELVR